MKMKWITEKTGKNSGKIAEKMAEIMTEMGNLNRQVISITHLPQIASLSWVLPHSFSASAFRSNTSA